MTVEQFFSIATDLKCDDIVTIIDATSFRILYRGSFFNVVKTVYAQYTVQSFSQKSMYIKVL